MSPRNPTTGIVILSEAKDMLFLQTGMKTSVSR